MRIRKSNIKPNRPKHKGSQQEKENLILPNVTEEKLVQLQRRTTSVYAAKKLHLLYPQQTNVRSHLYEVVQKCHSHLHERPCFHQARYFQALNYNEPQALSNRGGDISMHMPRLCWKNNEISQKKNLILLMSRIIIMTGINVKKIPLTLVNWNWSLLLL